jgi:PAS domain-containing protein
MNARAVRDEQGTILYYEGTVQDVTEKKEAEKALEAEHRNLEEANNALMEANAALNVLLKHHDKERKELEQRFLGNVQQLVMPYIERLKKSSLDPIQQISVNFIASNLKELVSPFLKNIHGFNLTPRQLEVAALIKEGRTTKDIGRILNMNQRAVEIQRFLIRKKLGFNKEKTNLQTYLKSLS